MPERETRSAAPRGERGPAGAEDLWARLDELLARVEGTGAGEAGHGLPAGARRLLLFPVAARRGIAGLQAEEVGELSRLYRAATTRLAQLQTFGASARRLEELNRLVARGHAALYGRPPRRRARSVLLRSVLLFPVVVRRTAACHAAAAAFLLLGALYGYFGASRDPEWALAFVHSQDERTPFASREELLASLRRGREGHDHVSEVEKTAFFAFLWSNNTKAALTCFFGGVLLGIPTLLALLANGALLGVYTATFHRHGLDAAWWAWILPHGVTELLCFVLLGGAGLHVAVHILSPGQRTRAQALADIRGELIYFVIFGFPMLFAAALLESFLRQSNLSDAARYAVGMGSAAFWAVYLGGVRPPAGLLEREEGAATIAEARVPLPENEELLGRHGRRGGAGAQTWGRASR